MPAAASADFHRALKLHRAGDLVEAIQCYRKHLDAEPEDASAMANLAAALCARSGGGGGVDANAALHAEAVALAKRAVQLRPSCPKMRHALGRVYEKGGAPRWREAADAYERACEKPGATADMFMDWGRALKESGQLPRAADAYAAAARLAPRHPKAHLRLATALRRLGRADRAAEHFRAHLEIDPADAAARFWLAALTGDATGEAAAACPAGMVAGLFDSYAEKFDSHLVEELGYRTPQLLRDLLDEVVATASGPSDGDGSGSSSGSSGAAQGRRRRWRSCADLGCGTGLMAPLLRGDCERLVGVDLSSGMAAKARERGCYDAVEVGEIVEWLLRVKTAAAAAAAGGGGAAAAGGGGGAAEGFDLLVAADVLVYLGDLAPLLRAAAASAPSAGSIFLLSTELLRDGGGGGGAGFVLQQTGRYAHSPAYIERAAAEAGWQVAAIKEAVIRHNAGRPIHGNLCALRRRPS